MAAGWGRKSQTSPSTPHLAHTARLYLPEKAGCSSVPSLPYLRTHCTCSPAPSFLSWDPPPHQNLIPSQVHRIAPCTGLSEPFTSLAVSLLCLARPLSTRHHCSVHECRRGTEAGGKKTQLPAQTTNAPPATLLPLTLLHSQASPKVTHAYRPPSCLQFSLTFPAEPTLLPTPLLGGNNAWAIITGQSSKPPQISPSLYPAHLCKVILLLLPSRRVFSQRLNPTWSYATCFGQWDTGKLVFVPSGFLACLPLSELCLQHVHKPRGYSSGKWERGESFPGHHHEQGSPRQSTRWPETPTYRCEIS